MWYTDGQVETLAKDYEVPWPSPDQGESVNEDDDMTISITLQTYFRQKNTP